MVLSPKSRTSTRSLIEVTPLKRAAENVQTEVVPKLRATYSVPIGVNNENPSCALLWERIRNERHFECVGSGYESKTIKLEGRSRVSR